MKMVKKKKLENLNKTHNQYIRSLGIEIDVDSGEILQERHGAPMLDHHHQRVIEFLVLLTKKLIRAQYQKVRQLVFRIIKVLT
jgi:hypothetical protein